jgi:cytochrome b6-f complex iron-sulfur subunit/menaquinol-cytochrome c reductase iron-sulfur subunit
MAEPTQKEAGVEANANAAADVGGTGASGGPAPVQERRGALRTLVMIGGLCYAGALVAPAARFAAGPASGGESGGARWIRLARLDDLPQGEPRRVQVIGDERDAFTLVKDQILGSVWVVREGSAVRALSAICPHLGCAIDLGADKKSFACPCHTSRFALSGDAETGPSPRGMDPLATRVQDGWVEVDYRRFRQGTPERKEVAG